MLLQCIALYLCGPLRTILLCDYSDGAVVGVWSMMTMTGNLSADHVREYSRCTAVLLLVTFVECVAPHPRVLFVPPLPQRRCGYPATWRRWRSAVACCSRPPRAGSEHLHQLLRYHGAPHVGQR